MTEEQKEQIRFLIAYYDAHGYDWSVALEYEIRKLNDSLPEQERWPKKMPKREVP